MDTASSSNVKVYLDNETVLTFKDVLNDGKTNHSKDKVTRYSNMTLQTSPIRPIIFLKYEINMQSIVCYSQKLSFLY